MMQFNQNFSPLSLEWLHDHVAKRKEEGWRYVQTLAVNTEDGIDLIYTFMKDGLLDNRVVRGVKKGETVVPSITDLYLEAFVFENEIHDLFGVIITDIAIDFGGAFYSLAAKEPMTIISPEQAAAREKARKIAAAKQAKEAKAALAAAANAEYLSEHPEGKGGETKKGRVFEPKGEGDLGEKLSGMDPEKVARVKAAMAAKAKRAQEQAKADAAASKEAELEEKLKDMDPEKAAKVRAAMKAKAAKAAQQDTGKDGE